MHTFQASRTPVRLHAHHHGAVVALVGLALLLALSDAHGQSPAAAAAQARPALAGAQGGLGAQPGLAQGGLAAQGSGGAQLEIPLRRPGKTTEPPVVLATPEVMAQAPAPRASASDMASPRKSEVKPPESTSRKAARGAKRSLERARHGTSGIDAQGSARTAP